MGQEAEGEYLWRERELSLTTQYWDLRSPNPVAEIALVDKAYSMDTAGKLLVSRDGLRACVILCTDDRPSQLEIDRFS